MQNVKKIALTAAVMILNGVEGINVESHHHHHHHNPSYVAIGSDPICSSAGCNQYNHPSLDAKSNYPRDYFVPNFGADFDISASQKHMKEQEKKFGVWNLKDVSKIDRDYRVANFGVDSDILAAQASIRSSEATLDHQWSPVIGEQAQ